MFIEDAIKEYIYEIQVRNYTPRTIKGYKNNILRFSQFIKNQCSIVELEDVAPLHIKQYLNSLKEKGYNYQHQLFVEAVDIDELCFMMTYIQLSLYGIPARVMHS